MLLLVARRHLFVFGDQLGDFVPCARASVESPCTVGATAGSRRALYFKYGSYWGSSWFMLPNPMYGSWSGFE